MSSELAFEDFLRQASKAPLRVMLERTPTPPVVVAERAYDEQTAAIERAMQSGSHLRLRLAAGRVA